jgi:hypothetical protein
MIRSPETSNLRPRSQRTVLVDLSRSAVPLPSFPAQSSSRHSSSSPFVRPALPAHRRSDGSLSPSIDRATTNSRPSPQLSPPFLFTPQSRPLRFARTTTDLKKDKGSDDRDRIPSVRTYQSTRKLVSTVVASRRFPSVCQGTGRSVAILESIQGR